jgi:hypothetical protein
MNGGRGGSAGMARAKREPVLLLETSDMRVELVQIKSAYTFRVITSDDDDGSIPPALTADEWCRVAIQLLSKCPDSKDPIGLVSATCENLTVTGKTIGRRGTWKAWLSDVGSDFNGHSLLEWSTSRPLDLIEIGGVFKAAIKRLSDIEEVETV